jgi:hypothetical protein
MPNRSRQADDGIANLDLRLTDLRAHFEAQIRTVRRAEECLLPCRGAQDAVAFDAAADTFRDQLTVVAQDRKTIGALLNQIVDDSEKLRFAGRSPKC